MSIRELLKAPAELTHGTANKCPIVLSTRIRLARNLSQYPFPGWAKTSQKKEVLSECESIFPQVNKLSDGSLLKLCELSELERQILFERHLISRELTHDPEGTGVIISRDQSCSIMINEEDHLRIQLIRGGLHLKRVWNSIDQIDDSLEAHMNYAFNSELGFLTACPTNVGTGLRASAMLHLPGLVISSQMEKVVRAVNQLGIAVRGIFGEGSDASGSIFQISNQQTLGESEQDIIKRLSSVMSTIIEREEDAREKILEKDANKLFDKIGRACGILKNGYLLSSSEGMNLMSLIRLAVDLGALADEYRQRVDRLFIESQPGHVQYLAKREVEPSERDVLRAEVLRQSFHDMPTPSFSHLSR